MPPRRDKDKDKDNNTTADNLVQDQLQATANIFILYPFLPSILLFPLFPSPTSAQDDPPTPVYQAQFTTYSNKTLYIRGGLNQDRAPVAQLYSLDLTPLFTNSIVLSWKKLNHSSPFTDFQDQLPLGVHSDNNGLTYFGINGTQSTYNSTTNTWTAALPTCNPAADNSYLTIPSSLGGRVAVTDPTIDVIYVPHGYTAGLEMLMYNFQFNTCGSVAMPEGSEGKYFTCGVSRGAIYMLGTPTVPSNSSLWERRFDRGFWELMPTFDNPPLFTGSCMTSAFGGEKLIVFGGSSRSGQVNGNVYIFDTSPRKWSVGAVSLKPRSGMVCASAGDYFVSWGGYDSEKAATIPSEMLFYNIRTNTWINQTIVPPGSGTDDTNMQETESKTAAIGGGATGVVIMIAFIVGLFILHRRRRRHQHKQEPTQRKHPQEIGQDSRSPPTSDKSRSDAYLISNIQPESLHPDAPHKPLDPAVSFLYSRNPTIRRNAAQELHYDPEAFVATFETQNPQALPPTETPGPASYPLPPSPVFSAPQHYHLSQQMDQLSWEESLAGPQCFVPPSSQRPDYARLEQEFSPPPLVARDPHKKANESLLNPLEQLALVQLKYEKDVERLRQEQLVELERIRKQWEELQHESAQS